MGSPAWKPPESTPPQQGRVREWREKWGFPHHRPKQRIPCGWAGDQKSDQGVLLGFPRESRRRKAWTPARGLVTGGACAVALIGLWRPRFNLSANSAKKGNGALDGRPRAGTFRHIAHAPVALSCFSTLARSLVWHFHRRVSSFSLHRLIVACVGMRGRVHGGRL